ncbi:MAG: glycoside hydrolase family 5 protein [Oligoflexales bacterium]|nr:glycoside hydrolase family 5 protein [Oligoflexales bacterium]
MNTKVALIPLVIIQFSCRSEFTDNYGLKADSAGISFSEQDLPGGDDWLHTDGGRIVDSFGNQVWLTGTNWFGYNTGTNTFDGIWSVNLEASLAAIAQRGMNILRIPISAELLLSWSKGVYPAANVNEWENKDLAGKSSLEIFDHALLLCKRYGLKVMLDLHSAESAAFGHMEPLWYTAKFNTDDFFNAWLWVASRYKNDDTIVAFDLKNEPHGKSHQALEKSAIWDNSANINNWKNTAENLARKILEIHPNILILVEGVESYPIAGKDYSSKVPEDFYDSWWGGNLRGVKDYPVNLGSYQNRLVYSPHDYGPAVFANQPWFRDGFGKEALYKNYWKDTWSYIQEQNIAPLLIGEWGGFLDGGNNEAWMTSIRDFMIEKRIHHTFWCFNANSGDTGGLVKDDFKTWDEKKYSFLKPALWQDNSGRFIGLDHRMPLGGTGGGTTVSDYYGE